MATAKKATSRAAPAKKKASEKKASAVNPADAVTLLTADHAQVKQLFDRYEKLAEDDAGAEERLALAGQICTMLTVHAQIEEELFYPAARDVIEEGDLLDEAEVEHASAKDLIAQILAMDPDEALYDAKVKVLGEYVQHHVQEEENELFPQCQSADMDLEALGQELAARKQELLAELGEVAA